MPVGAGSLSFSAATWEVRFRQLRGRDCMDPWPVAGVLFTDAAGLEGIVAPTVSKGSGTTEFKVAVLNKLAGFGCLALGAFLQWKGKDATQFLNLGVVLLLGGQAVYTAARTLVKNKAVEATNGASG